MTNNLRWMGWRSLLISLFLVSGSLTLNSCGNARSEDGVSGSVAPAPQAAESKADRVIADGRSNNQASDAEAKPAAAMPQKPQLVKTAERSGVVVFTMLSGECGDGLRCWKRRRLKKGSNLRRRRFTHPALRAPLLGGDFPFRSSCL